VFEHINLLGRYAFSVPDSVARGQLRPLRNPTDALEDVGEGSERWNLQNSCYLNPVFRS
jgi:hypothetical protein